VSAKQEGLGPRGVMAMRNSLGMFAAGLCVGAGVILTGVQAHAQNRIALKSGESTELHSVYWVTNCRSIVIGVPQLEVLEGPEELTLTIKEGMVLPRRQNCAKPVAGGTVVATAKEIKEPVVAKLTYRVIYKTKDGDRQNSSVYNVSLFP
jgi:hypothetical protein